MKEIDRFNSLGNINQGKAVQVSDLDVAYWNQGSDTWCTTFGGVFLPWENARNLMNLKNLIPSRPNSQKKHPNALREPLVRSLHPVRTVARIEGDVDVFLGSEVGRDGKDVSETPGPRPVLGSKVSEAKKITKQIKDKCPNH